MDGFFIKVFVKVDGRIMDILCVEGVVSFLFRIFVFGDLDVVVGLLSSDV